MIWPLSYSRDTGRVLPTLYSPPAIFGSLSTISQLCGVAWAGTTKFSKTEQLLFTKVTPTIEQWCVVLKNDLRTPTVGQWIRWCVGWNELMAPTLDQWVFGSRLRWPYLFDELIWRGWQWLKAEMDGRYWCSGCLQLNKIAKWRQVATRGSHLVGQCDYKIRTRTQAL